MTIVPDTGFKNPCLKFNLKDTDFADYTDLW